VGSEFHQAAARQLAMTIMTAATAAVVLMMI
jgi:hypothetical protein